MPCADVTAVFHGSEGFQRRAGRGDRRGQCEFNSEMKRLYERLCCGLESPQLYPSSL